MSGVAAMLGASCRTVVDPGEFVWEPSGGIVSDSLLGRHVIFLAREAPDAPRDVFRATVRVTLEGRPISVERVVNLSESPLGDEQGLVGRGSFVAFASVALGAVQQVTLLDSKGVPRAPNDNLSNAVMARLTNLQESGSSDGLGHTEVSANIKGQSARLTLDEKALYVSVDDGRARFGVDLQSGALIDGARAQQDGVSSMQVPPLRKPPIIWAVDTVRAFTGPEPIAWLEEKAFSARDILKKSTRRAFGSASEQDEKLKADAASPPPPPPPPSRPVGADGFPEDDSWPPQNLRTIWETPDPNEGDWRAPRRPFLKKNKVVGVAEAPPPYFMESFVRPDPERPYSKVLLVAMDARQLELGMEGGIEDPKPLTGARGEGRIPREPKILLRAVGAFNGAFKTTHGEYGMMVNRRVLLPPKAGAATVMVRSDGRAGFGTWPESATIPSDILSFRQNLEPLVEDQQLNPSNRKQWGWHLRGTRMLTHRSGLCVTATGQMVYAWGGEVTGDTLGRAMIQAGCVYAIHLDMNPHHTAFVYLDVRSTAPRDYEAEILTPDMEVLADRFMLWSPKDFFYLTLRDQDPPDVEGMKFQPDDGLQPGPAWMPAMWSAKVKGEGGTTVQLQAAEPSRAAVWIGGGTRDGLEAEQAKHVLAAIEVAPGPVRDAAKVRAGTTKAPKEAVEPSGPKAHLSVDAHHRLVIEASDGAVPAGGVEMALLRRGEETLAGARRVGAKRQRSALCVSDDGRLWTARATSVSYAPLVEVLVRAGCRMVVSPDGDGEAVARFHRSGTSDPPMDRYDHAALYVMARAPEPWAFPWKP